MILWHVMLDLVSSAGGQGREENQVGFFSCMHVIESVVSRKMLEGSNLRKGGREKEKI